MSSLTKSVMVIWAQMTRVRYTCICNLSQVKPETILDAIPNAIAALIVHFWRVNTSTPQHHLSTIQSSQESSVYPKCEHVGLHSARKFVQTALMSDTSSRVRAAADLQPTHDVFIIPLMVAATRPDLEQLIREDQQTRTACAHAAQISGGTTALLASTLHQSSGVHTIYLHAMPCMRRVPHEIPALHLHSVLSYCCMPKPAWM